MSDGARRALVTGASAGIGRACAGELHAAGWAVTGASRRGGRAGLLAKRLLPFRAFEAAAKSSLGV
jgi:NAD(P)-dependent dehydrogenase (short-subunit alcohol dehydrogenase family)